MVVISIKPCRSFKALAKHNTYQPKIDVLNRLNIYCPILDYKRLLENQVRYRHLHCLSSLSPPTKTWPQKPNIMLLSEMNPTCMDYKGDGSGLRPGKDQQWWLRKCRLWKEWWGKSLSPGTHHPLLRQNQNFRVPSLTLSLLSNKCLWKALAKLLWAHTNTAAGGSNYFISLSDTFCCFNDSQSAADLCKYQYESMRWK